MKRLLTRFLPFALPCFVLLFTGCGDDEKDPVIPDGPAITFSAPGLTITENKIAVRVTKDSTVVLNYSVDAPGTIEKLVQTVDGVAETVTAASGKTYTRQAVLNIPFEDKAIVVKVEVTDANEKVSTAELTVNVSKIVPPSKELTEAAEIILGGNNSASFFSRWDLDIPEGYSGWNLRNSANYTSYIPNIDIFYTSDDIFNTQGDNYGGSHPTGTGPLWPNGFGSFFLRTNLTKAQFDATTNDAELAEMTIDKATIEDITPGTVIAFVTKQGRRGLLYFDVKVEATDDWDVLLKIQVAD